MRAWVAVMMVVMAEAVSMVVIVVMMMAMRVAVAMIVLVRGGRSSRMAVVIMRVVVVVAVTMVMVMAMVMLVAMRMLAGAPVFMPVRVVVVACLAGRVCMCVIVAAVRRLLVLVFHASFPVDGSAMCSSMSLSTPLMWASAAE